MRITIKDLAGKIRYRSRVKVELITAPTTPYFVHIDKKLIITPTGVFSGFDETKPFAIILKPKELKVITQCGDDIQTLQADKFVIKAVPDKWCFMLDQNELTCFVAGPDFMNVESIMFEPSNPVQS